MQDLWTYTGRYSTAAAIVLITMWARALAWLFGLSSFSRILLTRIDLLCNYLGMLWAGKPDEYTQCSSEKNQLLI